MKGRTVRVALAAVPACLAIAAAPATTSAQGTTCPVGSAAVTGVYYVVFPAGGGSSDVQSLTHNVASGEEIHVLFDVPALPQSCSDVTLSIASYITATHGRHQHQYVLAGSQTGQFIAGGGYEEQVTVPSVTSSAQRVFAVFATGPALTTTSYGANLISSGRG